MYWRCSSCSTFAVNTLTPRKRRKTKTKRKRRTRTRRKPLPTWEHIRFCGQLGILRGKLWEKITVGLFVLLESLGITVYWNSMSLGSIHEESGCAPQDGFFFLHGTWVRGEFFVPWAYWALLPLQLQGVAVLGIALIAMGEEIGAEMALRTFGHLVSIPWRRLKYISFDAWSFPRNFPDGFCRWRNGLFAVPFLQKLRPRLSICSCNRAYSFCFLWYPCYFLLSPAEIWGAYTPKGCAFSTGLNLRFQSTTQHLGYPKQILSWCWPRSFL